MDKYRDRENSPDQKPPRFPQQERRENEKHNWIIINNSPAEIERVKQEILQAVAARGWSEQTINDLELPIEELLSNAVLHGSASVFRRAAEDGGKWQLRLERALKRANEKHKKVFVELNLHALGLELQIQDQSKRTEEFWLSSDRPALKEGRQAEYYSGRGLSIAERFLDIEFKKNRTGVLAIARFPRQSEQETYKKDR